MRLWRFIMLSKIFILSLKIHGMAGANFEAAARRHRGFNNMIISR
jgi:hypothetical protein